ncbi:hypothetical protein [Streptomyces sp. WAC 01325]|uniref:hypothetical protein n=1 Tax=Streptomyces sp. WAC 01325 TaxID=2203202 RepID=UPI00163BA326|nr:hypothetical protein [Streptomyces sp. WAC 01325]
MPGKPESPEEVAAMLRAYIESPIGVTMDRFGERYDLKPGAFRHYANRGANKIGNEGYDLLGEDEIRKLQERRDLNKEAHRELMRQPRSSAHSRQQPRFQPQPEFQQPQPEFQQRPEFQQPQPEFQRLGYLPYVPALEAAATFEDWLNTAEPRPDGKQIWEMTYRAKMNALRSEQIARAAGVKSPGVDGTPAAPGTSSDPQSAYSASRSNVKRGGQSTLRPASPK